MPKAQVINLTAQRTVIMTHGAAALEAIFAELNAYLEAMPALREEFQAKFHGDEALAMVTKAPAPGGGQVMSMAPTARLLAWRERCRRLARARGLAISPPPSPDLDTGQVVARLLAEWGVGANLVDIARALGVAPTAHLHPMGQGQGTL